MPIKIQTSASSTDPMVISQDEYTLGRTSFQQHYYLANCNSIFGGQDLTIPWSTLNNAVTAFCSQYSVAAANVALRFVYCYNVSTQCLYLRLQLCVMQQASPGSNTYNLLSSPVAWYQITQGTMAATQTTALEDPAYLTNFYYSDTTTCNVATLQPLSGDQGQVYVRTITYPWQNEVYQMYLDNQGQPDYKISFGACSYIRQDQNTLNIWPHGIVMYLSTAAGVPLLDNNNYIVMFHNKGADYGTMCPPTCNVYVEPQVSLSNAAATQTEQMETN